MKLQEVIKHFLVDVDNRLGRTTYELYTQALRHLVNLLSSVCGIDELEKITVLHLRDCLRHMIDTPSDVVSGRSHGKKSNLADSSIKTYVNIWKVFFNWCYQEELIDSNPSARLKSPRPEKRVLKTFASEHIYKMLDSFDLSTDIGFRDYVILLLLLDTGIRLDEIATLLLEDVHDTYIKVRGKGRKEREVGIHADVSKLLWKYVHKHRHPSNPDEPKIFIDCGRQSRGKAINRAGVKGILTRLKLALGLKDVRLSAHTFRHTFAKMYLAQGGDIFKLSREMGHSNVRITQKYLEDFTSTEARKEHDSYSPLSVLDISRYKKVRRKKDV